MFARHPVRRTALALALLFALLFTAGTAAAGPPATRVSGVGEGLMTAPIDPIGDPLGQNGTRDYPVSFNFHGRIDADGRASGQIHFHFTGAFANAYDADLIILSGSVSAASVGPEDAVTLSGRLIEKDYAYGQGLIFESDEPFTIVVGGPGLGADQFTLQWCTLDTWPIRVTRGHLTTR